MTDIKPIQTAYRGYHFRSRLEARWAVFFDALGMKWEYEPEGFEIPFVGRYLPDFFLPKFIDKKGAYVEVKPDGGDFTKAIAFSRHAGIPVLLLGGQPDLTLFKVVGWGYVDCSEPNPAFWSGKYLPGGENYPDEYRPFITPEFSQCTVYPSVERAILASRSARFEHGQSGATL